MNPSSAMLAALLSFCVHVHAQTDTTALAKVGGASCNLVDFIRDERFVDVKMPPSRSPISALTCRIGGPA